MNQINQILKLNSTRQQLATGVQNMFKAVAFPSFGDLIDFKFDITLDKEDVQAINDQIWS